MKVNTRNEKVLRIDSSIPNPLYALYRTVIIAILKNIVLILRTGTCNCIRASGYELSVSCTTAIQSQSHRKSKDTGHDW